MEGYEPTVGSRSRRPMQAPQIHAPDTPRYRNWKIEYEKIVIAKSSKAFESSGGVLV